MKKEETPEILPLMGMQCITSTEGKNVIVTHVGGLSLDLFEIRGNPIAGLSLYDNDKGLGLVRPMSIASLRRMSETMAKAADTLEGIASGK